MGPPLSGPMKCGSYIREIKGFNDEMGSIVINMVSPFKEVTGVDFHKKLIKEAKSNGWSSGL